MKEKNRTTLQAAIRRRVHAKAYPFCGAQTGLLVVINEQRNISALQISVGVSTERLADCAVAEGPGANATPHAPQD